MMSDPLYHRPEPRRLPADPGFAAALSRRAWLKLAAGVLALALIGAIWLIGLGR